MYVNPNDLFVSSLLLRDKVYEEYETRLFKESIGAGAVVVDVGSQIGYYTLMAAEKCGQSGRVYAFEPNERNFTLLQQNVNLNGFRQVTTVNAAVSSTDGTRTLFVDSFNLGKHSLSEENVTSFDALGGKQEVATVSLDQYMTRNNQNTIDVLKLDTEGAEGLIIEGAKDLLSRKEVKIFIEVWPFGQRNLGTDPLAMFTLMSRLGYSSWLIDESKGGLRKLENPGLICKTNERRASFNVFFQKE